MKNFFLPLPYRIFCYGLIAFVLGPRLVCAGEGKLQKSWWRTSRLEPVVLQLSWTHKFQFAGYYMSKEKGFYRDAGFDVRACSGPCVRPYGWKLA